jgi:hypothetical protein
MPQRNPSGVRRLAAPSVRFVTVSLLFLLVPSCRVRCPAEGVTSPRTASSSLQLQSSTLTWDSFPDRRLLCIPTLRALRQERAREKRCRQKQDCHTRHTRTSSPPDLGRGSPSVLPRVARSPPAAYRRGSTTAPPFTCTGGSPLGKVYVSSVGSSEWIMAWSV